MYGGISPNIILYVQPSKIAHILGEILSPLRNVHVSMLCKWPGKLNTCTRKNKMGGKEAFRYPVSVHLRGDEWVLSWGKGLSLYPRNPFGIKLSIYWSDDETESFHREKLLFLSSKIWKALENNHRHPVTALLAGKYCSEDGLSACDSRVKMTGVTHILHLV